MAQQLRICLDLGDHAADIGAFLRRHATMLVELDRVLRDALASSRCASERAIELMEIISIDDWCGDAPGTMIMVATRRKLGNERPSIISSSVTTSYLPGGSNRSTPLIRKGCLKSIVSRRERVVISRDRRFRTGREMRLRPWLIVRAFPANSYRFLAEWGAFARFRAIRRSAPCKLAAS